MKAENQDRRKQKKSMVAFRLTAPNNKRSIRSDRRLI